MRALDTYVFVNEYNIVAGVYSIQLPTLPHAARQQRYDVVLVDTAGRMQDNEPLMRALAKVGPPRPLTCFG